MRFQKYPDTCGWDLWMTLPKVPSGNSIVANGISYAHATATAGRALSSS